MALNLQDLIDIDLLAYFKSKLDVILNKKVDKVTGKGLSSYDFSIGYKSKLDNIADNAQVNVIEGVKIAGSPLSLDNKIANIPLATREVPGLLNYTDKIKIEELSPISTDGVPGQFLSFSLTEENDIFTEWTNPNNIAWFGASFSNETGFVHDENLTTANLVTAANFKQLPAIRFSFYDGSSDMAKYMIIPLINRYAKFITDPNTGDAVPCSYYIFSTIYENDAYEIVVSRIGPNTYYNFYKTDLATLADVSNVVHYYTFSISSSEESPGIYAASLSSGTPNDIASDVANGITVLAKTTANNEEVGTYILSKISMSTPNIATSIVFTNTNSDSTIAYIYGQLDSETSSFVWRYKEVELADATSISTAISDLADEVDLKANSADVYTKSEIDQRISGVMNYLGTKATKNDLPASGNSNGDVWHVSDDGSEWAWNGSAWEELGTAIDLSGYVEDTEIGLATTTDIDNMFAPYTEEP